MKLLIFIECQMLGRIDMALGGRPKEDGGHEPLKISLCMSVMKYLESIKNRSSFIENLIREDAIKRELEKVLCELFFSR